MCRDRKNLLPPLVGRTFRTRDGVLQPIAEDLLAGRGAFVPHPVGRRSRVARLEEIGGLDRGVIGPVLDPLSGSGFGVIENDRGRGIRNGGQHGGRRFY